MLNLHSSENAVLMVVGFAPLPFLFLDIPEAPPWANVVIKLIFVAVASLSLLAALSENGTRCRTLCSRVAFASTSAASWTISLHWPGTKVTWTLFMVLEEAILVVACGILLRTESARAGQILLTCVGSFVCFAARESGTTEAAGEDEDSTAWDIMFIVLEVLMIVVVLGIYARSGSGSADPRAASPPAAVIGDRSGATTAFEVLSRHCARSSADSGADEAADGPERQAGGLCEALRRSSGATVLGRGCAFSSAGSEAGEDADELAQPAAGRQEPSR